jgi:hypothetical protein
VDIPTATPGVAEAILLTVAGGPRDETEGRAWRTFLRLAGDRLGAMYSFCCLVLLYCFNEVWLIAPWGSLVKCFSVMVNKSPGGIRPNATGSGKEYTGSEDSDTVQTLNRTTWKTSGRPACSVHECGMAYQPQLLYSSVHWSPAFRLGESKNLSSSMSRTEVAAGRSCLARLIHLQCACVSIATSRPVRY